LEALHSLAQEKAPDRAALDREAMDWLEVGLRSKTGFLPSRLHKKKLLDLSMARSCLARGLIEPVPQGEGFCFRLTEQGRELVWRKKSQAGKNEAKEDERVKARPTPPAAARKAPDRLLRDLKAVRRQKSGVSVRAPRAEADPLPVKAVSAAGEATTHHDALSLLRMGAGERLSPINVGKESTQRRVRRILHMGLVGAGILIAGIFLSWVVQFSSDGPVSLGSLVQTFSSFAAEIIPASK
jgi:hypothetical protein